MRGAIAALGEGFANVWDMPTTRIDKGNEYLVASVVEIIRSAAGGEAQATIEGGVIVPNRIKGRPDWTGQSARTTAVQWRGIGIIEGILAGLGIPYTVVPPATWKRAMGVTADKSEAIVIAQRLFPACAHLLYRAKDDGRAEALLIAEHGRRARAGVAS